MYLGDPVVENDPSTWPWFDVTPNDYAHGPEFFMKNTLAVLGYHGNVMPPVESDGGTWVSLDSGDGGVQRRERVMDGSGPVHNTELANWLRSKGYKLRWAYGPSGVQQKGRGTFFGGVFDANNKLIGFDAKSYSDAGMFGKIVKAGLLAMGGLAVAQAVTAASAASAAGGAASTGGTAAAGAAKLATAAIPAAAPAAAAAVVPAALPAVATAGAGAGLMTTVAQAAPVLATIAKTAIPIVKMQQDIKAKEEQAQAQKDAMQLPIAPPAYMVQPSAAPMQYMPIPSQNTTPAWLIPAAIGGGVLLLALVLTRK